MTEYLLMGNGEMPYNEMKAAVDELLESNPGPLNVLEAHQTDTVKTVQSYWHSKHPDVFFYDEDASPTVVLMLVDESNFAVDDYWDLLDSLRGKVKVFAFNEQMYEIVPSSAEEEVSDVAIAQQEDAEADLADEVRERMHDGTEDDVPKMSVVGDMEVLEEMTLSELKRVAKGLGVEPDSGDRRSRDTWLDAIKAKGKGAFDQPLADVDVGEALDYQTKADNKEAFREAETALIDSIDETGAVDGQLVLNAEKATELRAWVSDTQILLSKISSLLGDF